MGKNAYDKIRDRDKIIVFLLALIPRLILIFCFAGVFRTPMDEMSTIATGAYFGGKDWTALTTTAKFYYGGGFTILFAPLFRLIDDTVIVYYIMLSVCAVLQSISAPISYHIMNRFMKIEDRKYLFVGALACSFMVVTRAMEVFNEHIIIGCLWISAWLLCKLVEDTKYKPLYTVLLMLLFSYLLTTHTRTKVIWIAFVLGCIFYRIVYKKWLVSIIPAILSGIVGYWGAGQFNNMIKTVIWDWEEGKFLRNASVNIPISLSDLKRPELWNAAATTIFGQINTIFVFTGGMAVIMLVVLCCMYWEIIVQWFATKKVIEGEKACVDEKPYERYIVVISLIFIMCVGAVIVAQSITWSQSMMEALSESPFGARTYGYKAVTYVRYMGPFLGPVFMCGIAAIYYKKDKLKKYLLPSVCLLGICQMIWIGFVLPHISNSRVASEVYVAFGGYKILGSEQPIGASVYLMGSVILLVIFLVTIICYYRKKILLPLILILILLCYQYGYGAIFWDAAYKDLYTSEADAGTALINQMSKEDEEKLPDTFYVFDSRKDVQKRRYRYQMLLGDYIIIAGLPKEDGEAHIVFSSESADQSLLEINYQVARIDENEYIYVNTEEYIQLFEAYGLKFEK